MSELDVAKEKIAYLKVWVGILVVTAISTLGWLGANIGTASGLLLSAAGLGLTGLCVMIFLLHRRINRHIESLRDL
jgi:hypothetical protein